MRAELAQVLVVLASAALALWGARKLRRHDATPIESDIDGGASAYETLPIDGVLDLHGFAPRDVATLVPDWIDACRAHGLHELRIVHGKGRGSLRRTVHAILARRSDVLSYRLAPAERGGWGATLVTLREHT